MIYAIINSEGVVIDTIVAEPSYEQRIAEIFPDCMVKVSDERKESKTAAIGKYYIKTQDYFTPYKSWTIDKDGNFEQKKTQPTDGKQYTWDEKTKQWVIVTKLITPIKK